MSSYLVHLGNPTYTSASFGWRHFGSIQILHPMSAQNMWRYSVTPLYFDSIVWCWVSSTPGLLLHPLQALQQSSKTLRHFIFHVHQHMNNACVWWRFLKLWQISKISESRQLCIFFDPLCRLTMFLFTNVLTTLTVWLHVPCLIIGQFRPHIAIIQPHQYIFERY